MRKFITSFIAATLLSSGSAQAAWMESSSQNFVIYADQKQEDLKEFSEQLESFHHAMAFLLGFTPEVPSPSNRVTIYVVRDDSEVRRLMGSRGSNVYAFYSPKAGGSFAIVPRVKTSNS